MTQRVTDEQARQMRERVAFEAWLRSINPEVSLRKVRARTGQPSRYYYPFAQSAWSAWLERGARHV